MASSAQNSSQPQPKADRPLDEVNSQSFVDNGKNTLESNPTAGTMKNKLQTNSKHGLVPKLGPKQMIVLASIAAILLLISIFFLNLIPGSKVGQKNQNSGENQLIAIVGGTKILKMDVDKLMHLENSRRQYQNNPFLNFDQAKDLTIRRAKVEYEAKKRGIIVTNDEIKAVFGAQAKEASGEARLIGNLAKFGWQSSDLKGYIRGQLLEQKLSDKLNGFRDVRLITLFWIFKTTTLTDDQSRQQATQKLQQMKDSLSQGKDYDSALADLENDKSVQADFSFEPSSPTPGMGKLSRITQFGDEIGKMIENINTTSVSGPSCGKGFCMLVQVYNLEKGENTTIDKLIGGDNPW